MRSAEKHTLRPGRVSMRFLPVLIWTIALVGVVAIFMRRSSSFEVVGLAQAEEHTVAAMATGELASLPVTLYQRVQQGDTLATLRIHVAPDDAHRLQAQQVAAETELERLKAELHARRAELRLSEDQRRLDYFDTKQRIHRDVEQTQSEIQEVRAVLEPDRALLEDLQTEIKIVEDLIARKAAQPYELQRLQAQVKSLAAKIQANEQLLAQKQENLTRAQQRLAEFQGLPAAPPSQDELLQAIQARIDQQEKLVATLAMGDTTIEVQAPFDGVVNNIFRRPGETVVEGEWILTIARPRPQMIVAYAKEDRVGTVQVGMDVQVVRRNTPAQVMPSRVLEVGPTIVQIPQRLWMDPNFPEWGLPVTIACSPDLQVVPNEKVWIRGL